jgi:hypothetical protein
MFRLSLQKLDCWSQQTDWSRMYESLKVVAKIRT